MNVFWKYLELIKKSSKLLILSIICQVFTAIFTVVSIPLIIPFFQVLFDRRDTYSTTAVAGTSPLKQLLSHIENVLTQSDSEKALLIICISLVIVFLLKNFFSYMAMYFMTPVRNGIIYDMRQMIYDKSCRLPISFFKERNAGSLLSLMSIDSQEVEWSILKVIEALFKAPFVIVGSVLIMLYISPDLSLFVFVLIVIVILFIGGATRSLKKQSHIAQSKASQLLSFFEESIQGIKQIHSYDLIDYRFNKFKKLNADYKSISDKVLRKRDLSSPISEFFGIVIVAALLWIGAHFVFREQILPETFFAFIFAFYQVIEPSKSFATAYYSIQKGMASLERIDHFLSTSEESPDSNKGLVESFESSISFDEVSFQYPGDPTLILDKISFDIYRGETLALIGNSGSGKSTIMDLLLKFYEGYQGQIKIDGKDYRSLGKKSIRKFFSYVSQDAFLFDDSVANNISMGEQEPNWPKLEGAAKQASAHDFICQMQHKYKQRVGQRGMLLSGGERQRIALARAIYKNAPIWLLDEPTSSVDAESDEQIQHMIKEDFSEKTIILVAHRLKTVQVADRVIFLKNGRIVENGKHDELLKSSHEYKKFVHLQSI